MKCKKCKSDLPENAVYCCFCGKKQIITPKKRPHKRAHGTGTIRKDDRYSKPYIALSPATFNGRRRYIGSYSTYADAQSAIEEYNRNGRPELYNATLEDIYKLWSAVHYPTIADNSIKAYSSAWKKFAPISRRKIADLRTPDFQFLLDGTSHSTAHIVQVMAQQLCNYAMENDAISKNYAEYIIIPKAAKSEKVIFTTAQIDILWNNSENNIARSILALIYTGFRINEFLALTPESVHLTEHYIIGGGKTETGTNRIVTLPAHIPEIEQFFSEWCRNTAAGDRLFPYTADEYRAAFYDCLIDLGLLNAKRKPNNRFGYIFADPKHLTPHSTRHTYASLCASAGVKPEALQKLIGHSNYAITANVYIHHDIEQLAAETAKLQK